MTADDLMPCPACNGIGEQWITASTAVPCHCDGGYEPTVGAYERGHADGFIEGRRQATAEAADMTLNAVKAALELRPDSVGQDQAYVHGIAEGRRQAAQAIRALIEHVRQGQVDDVAEVFDYAARVAEGAEGATDA